jgi:hypothetical protein
VYLAEDAETVSTIVYLLFAALVFISIAPAVFQAVQAVPAPIDGTLLAMGILLVFIGAALSSVIKR